MIGGWGRRQLGLIHWGVLGCQVFLRAGLQALVTLLRELAGLTGAPTEQAGEGWLKLVAEAPEATGNQPSTIGFTDIVTGDHVTSVVVGHAKNQPKSKIKNQNDLAGKNRFAQSTPPNPLRSDFIA
ncbi:hypothetical protein PGTUg99_033004 [Puccinia graminis f. sp. tritici]|uniref:Uncharacterized protein n=1 Tax=Puccinia graminis f. sp. tritici TaxID=56615 RepID=A0A5B0S3G3_PUCGR|nr:hypothetical protein PGTUg99_033004 [Puccinia graminis f. sp. tritici]